MFVFQVSLNPDATSRLLFGPGPRIGASDGLSLSIGMIRSWLLYCIILVVCLMSSN